MFESVLDPIDLYFFTSAFQYSIASVGSCILRGF